MKILDVLKTIWREYLAIDEAKNAFFHGCKELSTSKKWNHLFRCFKNEGELMFYDNEKKIVYLKTKDSIILAMDVYYNIVCEIFKSKVYSLPPQITEKDFIVFDMGMNRGYASLYLC